MNSDIMNLFLEFHEKSPLVLTDTKGNLTWMNVSFKTKFPALITSTNNNLYSSFAIEPYEESKKLDKMLTTSLFKCTSMFSGNIDVFRGVLITDGKEKLYCFSNGSMEEADIIKRISVVNMELGALSRELAKKKKEIEEANEKNKQLLRTDFLTGSGNRRYFTERLVQFCSRYTRNNEKKFCIVFADLNKFEFINNTFGHDTGDLALTLFSQSMKRVIRKEDVFARIGGDEFAMIIECREDRDCKQFIDKLRMATSSIKLPNTDYSVSSSFGYVLSAGPAEPEKMMKEADEKLYIDKKRIVN